jgi:hypothetical protein
MGTAFSKTGCLAFSILFACLPCTSLSQPSRGKDKAVWNYDGGILFETDGSLSNGICFRVAGRVTSPEFFDNLKRIEDSQGTVFRRGLETVTHFPDELFVSFLIHDRPCTSEVQPAASRTYLTREMMRTMQLSVYWKRGVDLRPVKNVTEVRSAVEPIAPYAKTLAAELPERFEWFHELAIPGTGVPLTDSLVLIFRTPDGHIAARVAARL